jgi:hypothetical protein
MLELYTNGFRTCFKWEKTEKLAKTNNELLLTKAVNSVLQKLLKLANFRVDTAL